MFTRSQLLQISGLLTFAVFFTPIANAQSYSPTNQIDGVSSQSDVIYLYRDDPYRTNITINGNIGGVCAEKMYVSVFHWARSGDFDLLKHPSVTDDILNTVRKRCPQLEELTYLTAARRGPTVYFQRSKASRWKLTSIPDPVDAYPVDKTVAFGGGYSRLALDNATGAVHGLLESSGPPMKFTGIYEPFAAPDATRGVTAEKVVTGQWYGYGDTRTESCETSRDGYAYWGQFELVVPRSQLKLYSCVDDYKNTPAKTKTITMVFWEQRPGENGLSMSSRQNFERLFEPRMGQVVRPHPILEAETYFLEKEPETRARFANELSRVKPGFVYKPYSYWTELIDGDDREALLQNDPRKFLLQTIRDTFDGIYYTKGASGSDFPLLYRGFTLAYGRRCRGYLEDPISITVIVTETDRNGVETREVSAPYIIEDSFHEKFKAYERVVVDYGVRVGMRMGMRGASMGAIHESLTRHEDTVDKVLAGLAESGCTSATMRQLRRNFLLRAQGRPSLQESGEPIQGAEAESQVGDLHSDIAEFDSMMAEIKSTPSRTEPYSLMDSPGRIESGQGIEIAYLYNYYAPSNWPFEYHIKNWLQSKVESIRFVRVPNSGGPQSSDSVYFSARKLGKEETIHDALFEAIHVARRRPASPGMLEPFLAENGIDAAAFDEAMKSPDVAEALAKAEQVHSENAVYIKHLGADLPMFLVNGKYKVSTATCRCGPQEMLTIVTELANKTD